MIVRYPCGLFNKVYEVFASCDGVARDFASLILDIYAKPLSKCRFSKKDVCKVYETSRASA